MSSISKASPSKNMANDDESHEESGWTTYFEDFFNNQNIIDENRDECSMSSLSSSLVSDAASLAARKLAHTAGILEFPMTKNGTKNSLSFKKRKKIRTALVDEALEDTASSPVNSPKVYFDNPFFKEKQKEEIDFYQEKGNTSGQRDEIKKLGLNNGKDGDCTELKKRGLCLVPLSMFVNYI
ncbi:hypothetical protein RIF29_05550 [Crotalaria pallida]|uniref:Uncharacterized protein n=1 Tax=Crotalaria pallida TaxID=3830 RepID=A0AAN9J2F0_CROPI